LTRPSAPRKVRWLKAAAGYANSILDFHLTLPYIDYVGNLDDMYQAPHHVPGLTIPSSRC
jgi:hypothetical protein